MINFSFTNINQFNINLNYLVLEDLKSFKEECLDYLNDLYKTHGEITLLFSGGMDSRFLARCLIELNIPFTALTYVFSPKQTDYDSLLSKKFCNQYNINQEIVYINADELFTMIEGLYNQDKVYGVLNNYYVHYALEKKYTNSPDYSGWFLTGACSEFKLNNKKITLPFNIYDVINNYPNKLFNFTTDRIFFSYLNHKCFVDSFNNPDVKWTDIRNRIYQDCFNDLEHIEKTAPNDQYITDIFYSQMFNYLVAKNPELFITLPYCFNVDDYFQNKTIL